MQTSSPRLIDPSEWTSFGLVQRVIDTLPDPIFVKDRDHRWIVCNAAFCRLIGHSYDRLIGRSDPDFWPRDQAETFWRFDDVVFTTGEANENEELATGADGVTHTIWTRKFPMRDVEGHVVGLCGVVTDITALKGRLSKVERLEAENREQAAVIRAQADLLDQLAAPAIQVWDDVLLVPLVGALNSRRAEQVVQALLASIVRMRARSVIIDVTGVPTVDTTVAGYLVRAAQAARLLGCRSIVVGIGPAIAQALVRIGVDLAGVTIRATLEDGLRCAIRGLAERFEES